jgi:hypothetical protein
MPLHLAAQASTTIDIGMLIAMGHSPTPTAT